MKRFFVFCLLCMTFSANATTYYFSTSGSDDNNGLSAASPKRTLAAANSLAFAGNTLLFKRGDAWYNNFTSFDLANRTGSAGKEILLDAYGVGPKPIITTLHLLKDAGWTNLPGTGTWQQTVAGYSNAWRLFANGISKYKVNTSDSMATEKEVDKPHEWYIRETKSGSSGIVYLNTGSASVSPTNVEIHPSAAEHVFLLRNSSYISFRNLDIRGGAAHNVVYLDAPSDHILFDSCIISRGNGSGILAENSLANDIKSYVSDITIRRCLIDKVWTDEENDPAIRLSGDGIFLRHGVDGGVLQQNTILNWGHSGISITSYALGVHGVHNIVVEQNDVSAGVAGYCHAIDMNGFDSLTTHNIIRRNYFHDYTTTGHILGSYNQIYSNIFAGVRATKMPLHTYQPYGVDWLPWQYRGGPWMEAHDNYLVNNTFADIQEFSVIIGDHVNNPNITDNNVVANNIFCSYSPSYFGEIALNISSSTRGAVYVQHNNFWDSSYTAPVARYKNLDTAANYSAKELNEEFSDYCAYNQQANPFFANEKARDFRLTDSTPSVIREGGTKRYDRLLGSGFTDYFGNPWHPLRPSMGAIQYQGNGNGQVSKTEPVRLAS